MLDRSDLVVLVLVLVLVIVPDVLVLLLVLVRVRVLGETMTPEARTTRAARENRQARPSASTARGHYFLVLIAFIAGVRPSAMTRSTAAAARSTTSASSADSMLSKFWST